MPVHAITDDAIYDAPTSIGTHAAFDPHPHLIRLGGKQYLPVQARLLWLRTEHPDADLTTDMVEHVYGEYAVFRAHVAIPGRGSASAYGSESRSDFPDYLEKASTKAVGRALAALGFGTQFACDLDEGTRLADAPVARVNGGATGYQPSVEYAAAGTGTITDKQMTFAHALVRELGIDDETLSASLQREYGVTDLADVGRADASGLIDRLKAKADALAAGGR